MVLGGALGAGVGVEVGAGVRVVVGVGVTPPCPPQLISGSNSISASSKPIYLKAVCGLVIKEPPLQSDAQCKNAILIIIKYDDINSDDENRQDDIRYLLLLIYIQAIEPPYSRPS